MKNEFYRSSCKIAVIICLLIVMMNVTSGAFAAIIAIAGLFSCLTNRSGCAICVAIFLALCMDLNDFIVSKSQVMAYSARFGVLLIGMCLAAKGTTRSGQQKLPFGLLIAFLVFEIVPSSIGWAPMISVLKLINFFVFICVFWFGIRNLQKSPKDLSLVRRFIFALGIVIVIGSLLSLAVPGIAYGTSLKYAIREGGLDAANEVYATLEKRTAYDSLFGGITNQSQTLAPILSAIIALILCDMIFVEKQLRAWHMALVGIAVVMSFMTRSRTGLVSLVMVFLVVALFAVRKVNVPIRIKVKLTHMSAFVVILVAIAAVTMELRNGSISKWLRKTDDLSGDGRSLGEAMTSTRQKLIDMSLDDFERRPLIGMGFQVAQYTRERTKGWASILSSPVEKGVVPIMILGEGGIIGSILFWGFVIVFCSTCAKKGNIVTVSLFLVMLATNLGEATIFSPGGTGGTLWWICVGGGFAIDTIAKYGDCRRRKAMLCFDK